MIVRQEDLLDLENWARYWHLWVSASFLKSYLAAAQATPFLPSSIEQIELLLYFMLRERALRELGYELGHRPQQVLIPLKGMARLLEIPPPA
ncbi:MAG: hypothetical protein HY549_02605 [Elusimicrobia bacterium]|nr:hypothetical protein [Elusimicrobiota bacterium]